MIRAVLEPRKPGEPRVARLSWESAAGAEPESVTATLDGTPLAVDDPRRIVLPAVDESQLHLLQIEMRFEGRVAPRVDITFGGAYADEVSTEMTALAISAQRPSARPPTAAGAQGWFLKDGEPLEVIAIDKGLAEVVVVVMGRPFPHFIAPRSGKRLKSPPLVKGHRRLRFVSPVSEETAGVATTFSLSPISPAYGRETGDLYALLTGMIRPPEKTEPRPEAAVAVAGLAAYEGRRRRAVVLIPDSRPPAGQDVSSAQVRRYLERLRIRFFVWDPEAKPAPHVSAWGAVRSVGDHKQLAAAYDELSDRLESQWIVWLDGRHLPRTSSSRRKPGASSWLGSDSPDTIAPCGDGSSSFSRWRS